MTVGPPSDGGPPSYPSAPEYPSAAAHAQRPGPAPGYEFAGFGTRLLGFIADRLLLLAVALTFYIPLVILPLSDYLRLHPVPAGQTVVVPASLTGRVLAVSLVTTLMDIGYFGGLVAWQGRTLGQRILGMVVVREEDGGRLPAGRALARSAIFWVPGFLGLIPYLGLAGSLLELIGLLAVLWDSRRQGWHDKLGRSLVIRRLPGYS